VQTPQITKVESKPDGYELTLAWNLYYRLKAEAERRGITIERVLAEAVAQHLALAGRARQ
jgi:hypothetical protein